MASVQNVKINCLDRKPNVYVIVNNLITQKFRNRQKKTLKADREQFDKATIHKRRQFMFNSNSLTKRSISG